MFRDSLRPKASESPVPEYGVGRTCCSLPVRCVAVLLVWRQADGTGVRRCRGRACCLVYTRRFRFLPAVTRFLRMPVWTPGEMTLSIRVCGHIISWEGGGWHGPEEISRTRVVPRVHSPFSIFPSSYQVAQEGRVDARRETCRVPLFFARDLNLCPAAPPHPSRCVWH